MKNRHISVRKAVTYLNNEEHDGGFWLPNIQRPFVWSEEQIERLFDSIMREYPISTLLVWRTKSGIKRRKFIDAYRDDIQLSRFQVPEDRNTKLLVLDGQQRFQSLFIGLRGSYNKKELFFDVLSGDRAHPEEMRYRFRFADPGKLKFPWENLKSLVFTNEMPADTAERIVNNATRKVSSDEAKKLTRNLWKIERVFVNQEGILYQELDSVDNPDAYDEDDVVEIFIRANSGGTKLGKSDLLFSLLTASWEDADESMEELIQDLNSTGYSFSRDFILKACLVILGRGASYDVKKFRDGPTKNEIINNWNNISSAIKDVRDFLYGKTFIRSGQAMPSYLGLIPLIYFRFHYPDKWKEALGLDTYILRTLLSGAFSGRPDALIDKCVKRISMDKKFSVESMFEVIHNDGRNIDISGETIVNASYGSAHVHIIFNLWYRQFDYKPAYSGNLPQIDHIFPQSVLKEIKDYNSSTGKYSLMRYPAYVRDQIANCMLLTADENGFQGKNDIEPKEWFAGKSDNYLEKHLIPKNPDLWETNRFDAFIEARKNLILERMDDLLSKRSSEASVVTPDESTHAAEEEAIIGPEKNALERSVEREEPQEVLFAGADSPFPEELTESMSQDQPDARTVGREVEEILGTLLDPIAAPSAKIAGFVTQNGKEIAYERSSKSIILWTQPVEVGEGEFEPVDEYDELRPRNSNLNRKNAPSLRLGNAAQKWRFDDMEELVDFVNWYSSA